MTPRATCSKLYPTRRSSDLGRGTGVQPAVPRKVLELDRAHEDRRGDPRLRIHGDVLDAFGVVVVQRLPAQRVTRSEEHTSELQSLAHLVCRLPLGTN